MIKMIFKAADGVDQVEDIWKLKTENLFILESCVLIMEVWIDAPWA
jgi:hypothetical protein